MAIVMLFIFWMMASLMHLLPTAGISVNWHPCLRCVLTLCCNIFSWDAW